MSYCADKEINKRLRELQRQGWVVESGHRHGCLVAPDGKTRVTFSRSPSDRNAARQFEREIAKVSHGKDWSTTNA